MESKILDEVSIADLFDQFIEASTMKGVLSLHHRILNYSDLEPCEFNVFYPKFKRTVADSRQRKNWRAKAIFSKIDKKANHRCYSNTKLVSNQAVDNNHKESDNINGLNHTIMTNDALQHHSCLIIGGGPAGLRTAIELQLLGAKRVMVAEKRSRFSRNNVVHLWPFVIDDLKSLGAKKFYGKFCAGSIDHISIRQLQLTLLKICLIIGCDFRDSCSYISNCPASIKPLNTSTVNSQTTLESNDIARNDINTNNNDNKQQSLSLPTNETDGDKTNKSDETICDYDLLDNKQLNAGEHHLHSSDFVRVSDQLATSIPNSAISELYIAKSLTTLDANDDDRHRSQEDLNDHQDQNGDINKENLATSGDNGRKNNHTISRSSPNINHLTYGNVNNDNTPSAKSQLSMKPNLRGTKVHFECEAKHVERELHNQEWDVIIGADGHRNTLRKYFPRKEFRGKLAIAITANFINRQTPNEAAVPEISGISFIYNQDMFNALSYDTSIDLENICYYKDDTHYFVMTAKKKSLIERGVLLSDYATTQQLLDDSNVNKEALLKFAKDAAYWTTGLEPLDFALNHYGQEDCAMFDFTSMYAAMNACKAVRTKAGGLALFGLVGDSLLEPFWPTGSGCARGFLSSFDAAWMCRQWAVNRCASLDYYENHKSATSSSKSTGRNKQSNNKSSNTGFELSTNNKMVLSVMAERESIYRILAQTTSENLQQNYSHWTLNPHTRYPNLNRHLVLPSQVDHLIVDENLKPFSLTPRTDLRSKKVKSPMMSSNNSSTRKSPKKLKSTMTSPTNSRHQPQGSSTTSTRSKSSLSTGRPPFYKSKSRPEVATDTYWEFEESYRNLSDDTKNGPIQYLNHHLSSQQNASSQREYSIYATTNRRSQQLSTNVYDDEMARRARDIDDCIRLRRQRNQLGVVRDQLLEQFCGRNRPATPDEQPGVKSQLSTESANLLNELKKLREQRLAAGCPSFGWKEDGSRDTEPMSPLFLLNSIRRCASFAERVKNFEGKLDVQSAAKRQNGSTSPKTAPIDNVKNLPQFATLQRLLTNRHRSSDSVNGTDSESNHGGSSFFLQPPKKSKIPIMKLTKDDWNVKCWEERLAAYEKRDNSAKENANLHYIGRNDVRLIGSLSKSKSVDSSAGGPKRNLKAPKQVEVFKDRIKEMANKLELNDELANGVGSANNKQSIRSLNVNNKQTTPLATNNKLNNLDNQLNTRGGGWVSHLRQELIKSSQQSTHSSQMRRNHQPGRPVKKLFDDTDDDDHQMNDSNKKTTNQDGGLDPNKHYDHLCINRPKNKYLSRNNYKSHLSRTRYDKDTSIVINRQISNEEKRLYMANLESRASSVNSSDACSDISTKAIIQSNNSSSSLSATNNAAGDKKTIHVCPRCNNRVSHHDGITVTDSLLHRSCLNCANCSITLRNTEIQYHLNMLKEQDKQANADNFDAPIDFLCAICKPSIRGDLCRVVVDRLARAKSQTSADLAEADSKTVATSMSNEANHAGGEATVRQTSIRSRDDFFSQRINYNELYKNIVDDATKDNNKITLPAKNSSSNDSNADGRGLNSCQARRDAFKVAKSESVDGSEVVTLVLPVEDAYEPSQSSKNVGSKGVMVDEEEIHRILHLDVKKSSIDEDQSSDYDDEDNEGVNHDRDNKLTGGDSSSEDDDHKDKSRQDADDGRSDPCDDSSSLNSALDSSITDNESNADQEELDSVSISDTDDSNSGDVSDEAPVDETLQHHQQHQQTTTIGSEKDN